MSPVPPGLEDAFQSLLEVVQYPLEHSEAFAHLNIEAPKGVLLYGPPGVGKTHLVRAISDHCSAHLTVIQGPEILGPYLGDSERRLRERFLEATKETQTRPSILFIDEIDSLAPSRNSDVSSARLVAQLLTLMDGLVKNAGRRLVVIGATNRPNALDAALRRPGRFDREISIDVPDQQARSRMLVHFLSSMPHCVDIEQLANATTGYVAADLAALCRESALLAINRRSRCQYSESKSLSSYATKPKLEMSDFVAAMRVTVASTRRGLSVDVAETRWTD
ncbi:hypothetical protein GGH95_001851, partial [Coemansia sp. RSA 1836]